MFSLESIARFLIFAGVLLLLVGGLLFVAARLGLPLGRLPGDIRIQTESITCLIPLATSLILSLVLTVLLNIVIRLMNR